MQKIALVFDFDDTLAPDSTSAFIEWMGVDAQDFWENQVGPLCHDSWDPVPAYLYSLLRLSNENEKYRITRQRLEEFASYLKFHKGVMKIFPFLLNNIAIHHPEISLEFYIISLGIGDIIRNCRIQKFFRDIWACDFHYNEEGLAVFPKNIVSFTDKTRYLFQISKGISREASKADHYAVNRRVSSNEYRIPLQNMIFVGDGLTDVPCFSVIRRHGGIAIGVYDKHRRERWAKAWNFLEEDRIDNLLSADYSLDSDLTRSMLMAIESIVAKM